MNEKEAVGVTDGYVVVSVPTTIVVVAPPPVTPAETVGTSVSVDRTLNTPATAALAVMDAAANVALALTKAATAAAERWSAADVVAAAPAASVVVGVVPVTATATVGATAAVYRTLNTPLDGTLAVMPWAMHPASAFTSAASAMAAVFAVSGLSMV